MTDKISEKQLELFINNLENKLTGILSAERLLRELETELFYFDGESKRHNKLEYVLNPEKKDLPSAFILGAGISCAQPFSLPNWTELVKRVSLNYFYCTYPVGSDCDYESFYKSFENDELFYNSDLYELAQYIENRLKADKSVSDDSDIKDRKMYTLVKNALYNGKEQDVSVGFEDSYLYQLASILKSNGVNRVITYNYDDCFEYAYNFNSKNRAEPVYTDDMLRRKYDESGQCYVYHVHGFIPYYTKQDLNAYEKNLSDEELKLILSEDSYSEIAHSSYKWRNTVQVDTLLRYRCIFLGFSATDKNFKRLINLLYWHEEKGSDEFTTEDEDKNRHYIFLTIGNYIKQIFGKNALTEDFTKDITVAMAETKARFLLQTLKDKKKYLAQVRLTPVWTTAGDICDIVREYHKKLSDK